MKKKSNKLKATSKSKKIFNHKDLPKPEFSQYIDTIYTVCSFISCFVCKKHTYLTTLDLANTDYEVTDKIFYHPTALDSVSLQLLTSSLDEELERNLNAQGWAFIRPGCGERYEPICPSCLRSFPEIEDPALLARLERLANGDDALLDGESVLDPDSLVN